MRAPDRAAPDVERRGDDVVDAEPFEAVHGSDDVDDRVEGTHFVKMDTLDRRVVDRRLGLRQPLEQTPPPDPARAGKRRALDVARDILQAMVGVQRFMRVLVIAADHAGRDRAKYPAHARADSTSARGVRDSRRRDEPPTGPIRMREAFFRVRAKLRRRDARAQHALGRDAAVVDRQASERAAERLEREPEIEQRAEHHVAGGARETIEDRACLRHLASDAAPSREGCSSARPRG